MSIVRIDSNYPNSNLILDPLKLDIASTLLVKPTIDVSFGYVDSIILELTLSVEQASGTVTVGKLSQDWDPNIVTYNNCPIIINNTVIEFFGGTTIVIPLNNEFEGFGIAVWGNTFEITNYKVIVNMVNTKMYLPKVIYANKVNKITWEPIKWNGYIRRLYLERNGIIIMDLNTDAEILSTVEFLDETVIPNTFYTYMLHMLAS